MFKIKKLETYKLVTFSAWVSKLVNILSQMIIIKMLTRVLPADEYAAFVLLTNCLVWFSLTDFGIGISMQNTMSEYRARDMQSQSVFITAAAAAIISAIVFIIFFAMTSGIFGNLLLKKLSITAPKGMLFFMSAAIMIMTTFFSMIYKYWYADNRGYLSNIVPAVSSVLILTLMYAMSKTVHNDSTLRTVLLTYLLPSMLIPCAFFIHKVTQMYRPGLFSRDVLRLILRRGMHFSVFIFMGACVLQVDYIVLSQNLDSQSIIMYNTVAKIFVIVFFVYNALLLALWPVMAESIARGRWNDIRAYIRKYMPLGIAATILSTIILMFLIQPVADFLISNTKLVIPPLLLVLFGFYYVIRVYTDTYATVLQSMNELKPFWKAVPFQAILSVALQTVFVRMWGVYGIVAGLIMSYLLTVTWYIPHMVKKHYSFE